MDKIRYVVGSGISIAGVFILWLGFLIMGYDNKTMTAVTNAFKKLDPDDIAAFVVENANP
jgi:hypothetical protein